MQRARCQEQLRFYPGSTTCLLWPSEKFRRGKSWFSLLPASSAKDGERCGGHGASCTGGQRKEMLPISCDAVLPSKTWFFCFLCLSPSSRATGAGGRSQCWRVLSSGAGSHKMNSVRLHATASELRGGDPPAALIKA